VSIEQAIQPETKPVENSKTAISSNNKSLPKNNSFIVQAENTTIHLQKTISMVESANTTL
jgi:hypothetical protein